MFAISPEKKFIPQDFSSQKHLQFSFRFAYGGGSFGDAVDI
jgi:hypothetical protein